MELLKQNNNLYRNFTAYLKAVVIYDLTFHFCERFINNNDRTKDQMVQAARSGKQNIIEGKVASLTSDQTQIKLLNIARASFQELLADFEDYLRTRNLKQWEIDSSEVRAMRELGLQHDDPHFFTDLALTRSDETIANMVIVLIHQEDVLLRKHIEKRIDGYINDGGFGEALIKARNAKRKLK